MKPIISFRVIGSSGPLSIYWSEGPFGNAIESKEGNGVVWLSAKGELLGAEFDDIKKDNDHQRISIPDGTVIEVEITNGIVKFITKNTRTANVQAQRKKPVRQKTTH